MRWLRLCQRPLYKYADWPLPFSLTHQIPKSSMCRNGLVETARSRPTPTCCLTPSKRKPAERLAGIAYRKREGPDWRVPHLALDTSATCPSAASVHCGWPLVAVSAVAFVAAAGGVAATAGSAADASALLAAFSRRWLSVALAFD